MLRFACKGEDVVAPHRLGSHSHGDIDRQRRLCRRRSSGVARSLSLVETAAVSHERAFGRFGHQLGTVAEGVGWVSRGGSASGRPLAGHGSGVIRPIVKSVGQRTGIPGAPRHCWTTREVAEAAAHRLLSHALSHIEHQP
jgi:hypothetical protein